MKERPILFSGAMVRALLDGSKTQTRRIAKGVVAVHSVTGEALSDLDSAGPRVTCPYGLPGDRLWVRETWIEDPQDDGTWHYTQYMGCKGSPLSDIPRKFQKPEHCIYREGWKGPDLVWRPSIHMPRWASRILLEITGVRVERLQDIDEPGAIAEGVEPVTYGPIWPTFEEKHYWRGYMNHERAYRDTALDSFNSLWRSINGPESWDTNPWVWVVEFKRVEK